MRPIETDVVCITIGDDESREFQFAAFPIVDKINYVQYCSVNVRLSPLQYTDVFVNGLRCRALQNSGTQLSLISQAVCDQLKAEVYGHIPLQGVVGDPIRAPLVKICIKPHNEPDSVTIADGIQVLCGVAPLTSTEYDVMLTSEVIEDLSQLPADSVCNMQVCADEMNECDDCDVNDVDVDDDEVSPRVRNVDDIMSFDCMSDTDDLIEGQQADVSLQQCWAMAMVNKGGFVVHQGVLYHLDNVEGQQVCQLCVPTSRRDSLIKLAHDSVFSGHVRERKT